VGSVGVWGVWVGPGLVWMGCGAFAAALLWGGRLLPAGQCRQRTASTQSRCGGGVAARLRLPGARSGLPCHVPDCCCRGRLARAGSGSHSGVELCRSRTGEGSSGGRKKGVV
jgi:hypothetical protein